MAVCLLVDFGGTNARFELRRCKKGDLLGETDDELLKITYGSAEATSFEGLVGEFMASISEKKLPPPSLCVASVCGPVLEGTAHCMSVNLGGGKGLVFGESEVAGVTKCPTTLLNDYEAVGVTLPHLPHSDLALLHPTETVRSVADLGLCDNGVKCCLGPGTGLGNVFSVPDKQAAGGRRVFPSEGCMSEFVPRSQLQWDFTQWVARRDGYVPVDSVVSGLGIEAWFRFLFEREEGEGTATEADRSILEQMSKSTQPAAIVAAHQDTSAVCKEAVRQFLVTLGAEAANMGLRYLARGGVYIAGGGIPGKLFEQICSSQDLVEAYRERGAASAIIAACPLVVARTADLSMIGARVKAGLILDGSAPGP